MCMKFIIIFLTEVSFLEFILDLDKYIFPLADIFFWGGRGVILDYSCLAFRYIEYQ